MTKKDYIAIAKIIDAISNTTRDYDPRCGGAIDEILGELVLALAAYCQDDNPRFDRAKFIIACGY